MAGGRPTKYSNEILGKAYEYYDNFDERTKSQKENGDESWEAVPSHVGLARFIEIDTTTLYAWARDEDKEEFSLIVKLTKDFQHFKLLNLGLRGEIEKTIAKLSLSKHGYAEKTEVDNTSSDGSMSPKAFSQEQYALAQKELEKDLDLD